jgi:hypothetical protein
VIEMWIAFAAAGLFIALKHKWHWVVSLGCLLAIAYLVMGTHEGRADVASIAEFLKALGSTS